MILYSKYSMEHHIEHKKIKQELKILQIWHGVIWWYGDLTTMCLGKKYGGFLPVGALGELKN